MIYPWSRCWGVRCGRHKGYFRTSNDLKYPLLSHSECNGYSSWMVLISGSTIGDICKTIHCNRALKYLWLVGVLWLFSLNNLCRKLALSKVFQICWGGGGGRGSQRNFLIYRLVSCQKLSRHLLKFLIRFSSRQHLQQSNPIFWIWSRIWIFWWRWWQMDGETH